MNKHTSSIAHDEPGLRFGEIQASLRLASYCSLIEMILDQLDRHIPADDETWTAPQRRKWSRARGLAVGPIARASMCGYEERPTTEPIPR